MRNLTFLVVFGTAATAACASSPKTPPPPPSSPSSQSVKPPAPRPIRGVGRRSRPGQAELEAAIKAAKQAQLEQALTYARTATQKNPNLEQAWLLAGSICGIQGNLDCERETYEEGLTALPRSSALLRERATLHLQVGEHDAAVAKYEQAYAITGDKSPETMADLAYAYVYVDRLEEGLAIAQKAVELNDKCFTCYMALGQVHLSRKSFGAALTAYQEARTLKRDDPDASRSVAKALFLLGKVDEAGALFEALVKAAPDDPVLRMQAIQVAEAGGRYQAAVEHLKALLADHPNQKELWKRLANNQEKVGDKKGASASRKKASKIK